MKPTLLVFINQSPWNELFLRGEVTSTDGAHKINYRGLVLLYTSKQRIDRQAVHHRGLRGQIKKIPRGAIVGACRFRCEQIADGEFEYHLADARRFPEAVSFVKHGPRRFYFLAATPAIETQLRAVGLWEAAVSENNEEQLCQLSTTELFRRARRS